MNKAKFLWWVGLVIAVLTAIVSYCSCTAGISVGRANRVEQTVTNLIDSTAVSLSIIPKSK